MPRQQLGLNLPVGLPGLVGPSSCQGWTLRAGGVLGSPGGPSARFGWKAGVALRGPSDMKYI
ncbi:hypothetical protein Pyn_04590 [Prunus yedoensis var. nudiflora]|uniref:Uncharacterized protein n=1 Tax=Prunus yedoensis var. nudiflora TaxID=2094558 RepID=A0A314ZSS5_PRUYE|nr:hypothetical protein Pyn_04590 [Prunus yedoensis var. nudiflora]